MSAVTSCRHWKKTKKNLQMFQFSCFEVFFLIFFYRDIFKNAEYVMCFEFDPRISRYQASKSWSGRSHCVFVRVTDVLVNHAISPSAEGVFFSFLCFDIRFYLWNDQSCYCFVSLSLLLFLLFRQIKRRQSSLELEINTKIVGKRGEFLSISAIKLLRSYTILNMCVYKEPSYTLL